MRTVLLVLGIAFSCCTPAAVSVEPFKVSFTVSGAENDPVNAGLKATGAFFFDESLATPGALLFDPDGLKVPYINFPRDGMYTMRMSSC